MTHTHTQFEGEDDAMLSMIHITLGDIKRFVNVR